MGCGDLLGTGNPERLERKGTCVYLNVIDKWQVERGGGTDGQISSYKLTRKTQSNRKLDNE